MRSRPAALALGSTWKDGEAPVAHGNWTVVARYLARELSRSSEPARFSCVIG